MRRSLLEKRMANVKVAFVPVDELPPRKQEKPITNKKINGSPHSSIHDGAIMDGDYIAGYDWNHPSIVHLDEVGQARLWLRACGLNESLAHGRMRAKHGAALRATARGKYEEMRLAKKRAQDALDRAIAKTKEA